MIGNTILNKDIYFPLGGEKVGVCFKFLRPLHIQHFLCILELQNNLQISIVLMNFCQFELQTLINIIDITEIIVMVCKKWSDVFRSCTDILFYCCNLNKLLDLTAWLHSMTSAVCIKEISFFGNLSLYTRLLQQKCIGSTVPPNPSDDGGRSSPWELHRKPQSIYGLYIYT
ncbi:hypothetical protein AGLY_013194 [Aphis glycines]|uniref:Uncharacterized protein n=1 Tax=Aphis glycines TaxID=307491 RepID=A0A6G0T690_APHGL|nr:hypothetical protein AGLY_013194 [Aphis glycines]